MTVVIHYLGDDGQVLHDKYENIPVPGVAVNPPGIVLVAARVGEQAQAIYPLGRVVKIVLDNDTGIIGATNVTPFTGGR